MNDLLAARMATFDKWAMGGADAELHAASLVRLRPGQSRLSLQCPIANSDR